MFEPVNDNPLYEAAHEMRNALNLITLTLPPLRAGCAETPPLTRRWETVERQVVHLRRLVDDLLDTARIEQGKLQLAPIPVDLAELVRTLATDEQLRVERAGLMLALSLAPQPLPVDADPTRIAQILANLVGNALQFTPRGGCITIRVEPHPSEPAALLVVQDDGVGIEPEQLGRIFGRYTQIKDPAAPRRSRLAPGLGLGLALVQQLVELHGGAVQAHSRGRGQGAAFTCILPLAPAARAAARESR